MASDLQGIVIDPSPAYIFLETPYISFSCNLLLVSRENSVISLSRNNIFICVSAKRVISG